jgi:hypothetical protein
MTASIYETFCEINKYTVSLDVADFSRMHNGFGVAANTAL